MAEHLDTKETVTLEDAELASAHILQPELGFHVELVRKAFDLIALALDAAPELPIKDVHQSRKVATVLFIRLANDIRSAALLAIKGYPLQAASLVASAYEVAFTLAYIGSDDTLAQKWVEHDDPTCIPFKDVKKLTTDGLRRMKVPNPEEQSSKEYRVYRQLCWAKHGNPILQKLHGFKVENGNVYCVNGPDTSDASIRASCFSLGEAAHLTYLAIYSFVTNHVPAGAQRVLMSKTNEIGAERKRLMEKANARWGKKDPFPGKWRA